MKKTSIGSYFGKFFFFSFLVYLLFCSCSCTKLPTEHKVIKAKDGEIIILLDEVNDGKVHFFTYKKNKKRINFFVRKDGKGNLSAYFDACYICYKKKKGYRIEKTDLICNECNLKFRIADIVWENKDCSPIILKSKKYNENLIIKVSDVEKGSKLF